MGYTVVAAYFSGSVGKSLSFLHTYFSKTLESQVSFSRLTAFKY